METGENIQALRKILDFMRLGSITVLLIHFYCACYPALKEWGLTWSWVDRFIVGLSTSLFIFKGVVIPKVAALVLLTISQIGVKGKKSDKLKASPIVTCILAGLLIYFLSTIFLKIRLSETGIAELYITLTSVGYLLILAGASKVSRLLFLKYNKDIFNELNETFPQEERLLENEDSINLETVYNLKGKLRKGFINIISPFRGTIIAGTAGAGKSFFIVRNFLTQMISKQYTLFVYDFKYPDLTNIVYNTALRLGSTYPVPPKLYIINFDDLSRSHRCNAIDPTMMLDITDATESSRTIMLALNREWIKKQGDFFTESPINFVTAIFWFLKKYENGKFCTLPHAIELVMVEYRELFPVLSLEDDISQLVNPFISAFVNSAFDQLEGQIASAKICLARLVSPSLYYVLSGNDFTLDVNNPAQPKLVCVGNNPSKQQTYGAVLSLYIERMLKQVNKKGKLKSGLIFDEFPTVYVNNIASQGIAIARSNKLAITLCVQDISQLKQDYGKDKADVIMNVAGNVISGQVLGESSKLMSERIGRIMQDRESLSINSNDTSLSKSNQLESAIPASRIANLSSGEFVGAVADTPSQRMKLKAFAAEVVVDLEAVTKEQAAYQELPIIRNIDQDTVMENYYQIKRDIQEIIAAEMNKIRASPDLAPLLDKKPPAKQSNVSL